VDYPLFDARVDHEWPRNKRYAGAPIDAEPEALRDTYQHMVADEDVSEETVTQRMNDAIRMQTRLYTILR